MAVTVYGFLFKVMHLPRCNLGNWVGRNRRRQSTPESKCRGRCEIAFGLTYASLRTEKICLGLNADLLHKVNGNVFLVDPFRVTLRASW